MGGAFLVLTTCLALAPARSEGGFGKGESGHGNQLTETRWKHTHLGAFLPPLGEKQAAGDTRRLARRCGAKILTWAMATTIT